VEGGTEGRGGEIGEENKGSKVVRKERGRWSGVIGAGRKNEKELC